MTLSKMIHEIGEKRKKNKYIGHSKVQYKKQSPTINFRKFQYEVENASWHKRCCTKRRKIRNMSNELSVKF